MNTCILSISGRHSPKFKFLTVLWLTVFVIIFGQISQGQEQLTLTSGLQPQEQWISGPEKTSLGAIADLQIPAGYRFTGSEGARNFLRQMNNPVPSGLIGILTPNSGEWMAVIEFNQIGHVSDARNNSEMNFTALLKAIKDRTEAQNNDPMNLGGSTTASVDWESQPVYDEKDHSLEWAVRAETQSGKVVNHSVVLLGRQGVLDVTMVKAYQGLPDLVPLKQLVKNISFKRGQAYADYQKGDKMAVVSLANLVVNDEAPAASEASENLPVRAAADRFSTWYIYYYALAGGVFVFIIGALLVKNRSKRRKHSVATEAVSTNGNGSNQPELNGSNGHITHRKRRSNFGKFYASMVQELSHTDGEYQLVLNGNSGSPKPKPSSPLNGSAADPAVVNAGMELITNQKSLIEEQRRFMQQQARLIDEKSHLIQEQSRLLERQSDLLENQFPLKFEP
jgi:uncharacterized membrane-anchored protein